MGQVGEVLVSGQPPKVEEFKLLGLVFRSNGDIDSEVILRINAGGLVRSFMINGYLSS